MKKRTRLPLAGIVLCLVLAACGQQGPERVISESSAPLASAPEAPAATPLYNYDELTEAYLHDPFQAGMLNKTWSRAVEIDPECFPVYFVFLMLRTDPEALDRYPLDTDGYGLVPEEELETAVRAHFDVPVEHIRDAEDFGYRPDRNAYGIYGVGSVTQCQVIDAEQAGDRLTLTYDFYRIGRYGGRGVLQVALKEDGGYRYAANEILREGVAHKLIFPSAHPSEVVITDSSLTMNAGGWSGRGAQGAPEHSEYDGRALDSIAAFYSKAAAQLGARGEEQPGESADSWAWSGTYGNRMPLEIAVYKRAPGDESYTISIDYRKSLSGLVEPLTPRDAVEVTLHEEKAVISCRGLLEELAAYYAAAAEGIGAVGSGHGIEGRCWKWSGTYRGEPLSIFISGDDDMWNVDIRY